jgi:hypothetical protein
MKTFFYLQRWGLSVLLLVILSTPQTSLALDFNISPLFSTSCDNVTNGGVIAGNETGCANPTFDPSIITNVSLPTGGTGDIEYMWMKTTVDPNQPVSTWTPIAGSNSPEYDPGPITQTTWYTRCSRRSGCTEYSGESNIVGKFVECCVNFEDGGIIGVDQANCGPFTPDLIENLQPPTGGNGTPTYKWYKSITGPPFSPNNWDLISGANELTYQPSVITETTWFIRVAIREFCTEEISSNSVKITIVPEVNVNTSSTEISCFGGNDGSATVTVSGGAAPFTYLWNTVPAQTTATASGLTAGTYTVTVTDDEGCSATASVTINQPAQIGLTITKADVSCFGGNDGSATVTVSGGTAPFTYLWNTVPAQTTATATGLTAGTYTVTVTDDEGCSATASVTITQPAQIGLTITKADVSCFGGNDGSATVTVSGGTAPFTYLWNTVPAQTTTTATGLTAGTYSVTVTDDEGCSATASVTITQPAQIGLTITKTDVSCFGGNDGSATVTVIGGTAPFTYLWNTIPAQATATASGLTAGTYSVTVTDDEGCSATASVTINQPAQVGLTITKADVSCFGGNDGSATVTVSGGAAPFTYLWNTVPFQTTATASGLTAGTYSVTVTDDEGCSATASVTITQPAQIGLTITKVDVSCFGGNDGSATVTVSGGSAPFTYLWNTVPAQTTATASGLTAGTYSVTVTDDEGCSATASVTINQPAQVGLTITKADVSCFGGNDGSATVTVSGGAAPFTYLWNTVPAQTTATATGLTAGTYSVTVTDDEGCSATASVTITQPAQIGLTLTKTDVSCFGGNDGSATVTVSGGTAPFTYLWNTVPAQTTATATGLTAGTYSVTVTDDEGCSATASVTITQLVQIVLSISKAHVSCFGGNDGSATVTVSGGTAPFTYLWNTVPAQTTATATGLTAGTYSVTVTDDEGCSATASVNITQPAQIGLTITKADVSCFGGNDGSATVTVSGGTAPFTYLWNTIPAQATATASGLTAGTYSVTVTDDEGCSATASVNINQPAQIGLTITKADVSCFGGNDGSATVTVSGGTAPFTYLWNTVPAQTTATASGLTAGTYSVTVTDDEGCSATASVTINQPAQIGLTITKTDVSCFGGNDGSATVTVSGGTAPFTYLWNTVPAQTTATASGLTAGTYTVTVTDDEGCSATASVNITQPAQIGLTITKVDVSCFGGNDGSSTVTVSGGTAPFTYLWNTVPAQTTATATGLTAGTYTVTVTDDEGCSATASVTITQPAQIGLTITKADVSCFGGNDGSATVTVSGGTAPFTYLWNTVPAQTTATASGLTAGTYSVTVTDDEGCSATASVTITQPAQIGLTITKADVSCFGGNDGSATVTVSGGTAPFTYLWNTIPAQTTATASGLTSGTYSVTVTDDEGCSATASVTINQPAQIGLTITKTDVSCFGGNDGSATVTVSGGTAPFTYLWNTVPAQTTATASGLTAGTYSVTVTDDEGCSATASVTINQPAQIGLTITKTDVSCFGGNDGSATVTVSGGSAPFTYLWNTVPAQTTATASGLTAGTYNVTVTDDEGCSATASVTITQPAQIGLTITKADVSCFGGNDGSATVTVSGGTAPFTYLWNTVPAQTTATATGLGAAGTYYRHRYRR